MGGVWRALDTRVRGVAPEGVLGALEAQEVSWALL